MTRSHHQRSNTYVWVDVTLALLAGFVVAVPFIVCLLIIYWSYPAIK